LQISQVTITPCTLFHPHFIRCSKLMYVCDLNKILSLQCRVLVSSFTHYIYHHQYLFCTTVQPVLTITCMNQIALLSSHISLPKLFLIVKFTRLVYTTCHLLCSPKGKAYSRRFVWPSCILSSK